MNRPRTKAPVVAVLRTLWIVATILFLLLSSAALALASGTGGSGGCNPETGSCGVGIGAPGSGEGTGSGGGSSSGGGVKTAGCHNTNPERGCNPCPSGGLSTAKDPAACLAWEQNLYCSELNPQGLSYQQWEAELKQAGCVGNTYNPGSPAVAAQRAYRSITFPRPSGDRSPSQHERYRGSPFTYVGLWTWFWTAKSTWKTLTATATDGTQSATVTARPVALVFDPGDGSAAVRCSGPGRTWTSADGNGAPADDACAYQYRQVTNSPITSTQSIVWTITWIGTGNSKGEIPQLTTSTSGRLSVMQIQTVVTR